MVPHTSSFTFPKSEVTRRGSVQTFTMPQEVDDVETVFYREILAEETLIAAYFNLKSLNTRQFLDEIQEMYMLAQLPEADAELVIKVLISTRARVRREIRSETMSAVAEKVATLWTKSHFLQKSSWLPSAELQAIVQAYFDESVSIRGFHDKIRGANANTLKAALMCSRSCLFRASKQVQAMERTLADNTLPEIAEALSAENSGGSQPAPVRFVIEEQSLIEIFNPKFNPKVGRILIENDSAIWCGCGKDPPVAIEGTQRERTNARVSRAKRAGVHRIARVKSKESWSAQNCECQEHQYKHYGIPWNAEKITPV